jgi:3D (Asp-Asp-Asp) domain-containing protein
MKNTTHRRRNKKMRRRYKQLAAAVAGAAIMASGLLPGIPAAAAHASANPAGAAPDAPAVHQKAAKTSANVPANFKQVLNVKATAYAPGPHDNGKWGNKTHLGTTVRPGVVAVDPRVIPLGSRLYVVYPDGHGQYATAEDTGGAIKGKRMDIAMRSVDEAQDFGIQNVKVYVLGKA